MPLNIDFLQVLLHMLNFAFTTAAIGAVRALQLPGKENSEIACLQHNAIFFLWVSVKNNVIFLS